MDQFKRSKSTRVLPSKTHSQNHSNASLFNQSNFLDLTQDQFCSHNNTQGSLKHSEFNDSQRHTLDLKGNNR